MNWYILALKNYVKLRGRSTRSEYWYFLLFNVLIGIVLGLVDVFTGNFVQATGQGLFGALYSFAILIPSITVLVRRLHDTNRSGWWFFVLFIPLIGWIILFIFMLLRSDPHSNQYGDAGVNID